MVCRSGFGPWLCWAFSYSVSQKAVIGWQPEMGSSQDSAGARSASQFTLWLLGRTKLFLGYWTKVLSWLLVGGCPWFLARVPSSSSEQMLGKSQGKYRLLRFLTTASPAKSHKGPLNCPSHHCWSGIAFIKFSLVPLLSCLQTLHASLLWCSSRSMVIASCLF